MAEKDLHKSLREKAYKKHGAYNPDTGLGLLKIVKLTMLAQYGEAGMTDWLVLVKAKPIHAFFIELKNPDGSGECTDKQIWMQ